jgi:hypothetical protein
MYCDDPCFRNKWVLQYCFYFLAYQSGLINLFYNRILLLMERTMVKGQCIRKIPSPVNLNTKLLPVVWSMEHKEVMKDGTVKRLKDQLFIARAHYPSIAKLKQQERFTRELKQNIQEHERMLSDTTADADLPPVLVSFN